MRPFVPRLAVRVYLIGLAQIAVVAAGAHVLWSAMLPPELPQPATLARYVSDRILDAVGDPVALSREVARARNVVATIDIFDEAGAVVLNGSRPGAPQCWTAMPADGAITTVSESYCLARRTVLRDGRAAYVSVKVPAWPPLSRVVPVMLSVPLVIIAISSLILGRMLSRPMQRISAAARAFGAGKLGVRVALERDDEVGEVARAFDDMAERVADLLRAERELMANISHELRTPLARIRVALDLAAEGDSEVARESLKDIAADLEELEKLIGDVLTVARLDLSDASIVSSIPALRRQRVDVHDLVERAASRFRSRHPQRAFVVENTAEHAAVNGDPVLLRRVLDNLLENANKYSNRPEDGVELRADAQDGVCIRVVDHGIGIATDDLKRVFRPFFRADRSRNRATGGLGLGLVLVRRIVEAHGGRVHLESIVGQGTTAVVHLPGMPRPLPAASDPPASRQA
ncbi:MAG TPA: HAMP domain-containing sensor histidine kinase [Polyangiaceae bacterium]|nr:HAMP domain-containing sensor histidine kinase [Polyangiaceae bacterium]